jgi:hypothetical protein
MLDIQVLRTISHRRGPFCGRAAGATQVIACSARRASVGVDIPHGVSSTFDDMPRAVAPGAGERNSLLERRGEQAPEASDEQPDHATRQEAIVYSVALVIPLVQLPPLDRWRPSGRYIDLPGPYQLITFETFAAIYRLAGFLFVPLAVGVVTGLLYRRDGT